MMIGTILGNRYELLEKIGEGGMAIVYKAKCHLLDRFVAVKILKEQYSNDIDFVEKFKNEATAAASLSHNNIVSIYDVGSENNINYIVMEYVNGKTLKKIITENTRLNPSKTIEIAIQIASGLECAHKNNLIHRDIKPHNILVTEDGVAKIADFGIAKVANSMTITNSGQIIGSAHYFSPEQAKGGFVDCTTDIYSLGIVMYEMVTGKVPYDADSAVSIAIKHIQEAVVPPKQIIWDVPDSLNSLILKAIEKEPIKRYQSAKEMLVDLNRIKNDANAEIKLSTIEDDFTKVMAPVVVDDKKNIKNKKDDKKEEDIAEEEEEDVTDKKGMKKSTKIILISLAFVLLIVVAASAGKLLAVYNTNKNAPEVVDTIIVPELLNKPSAEVSKTVTTLGLKFTVFEHDFDDQPKGNIIFSNYKAGDKVPKGTEIRVKISDGKETVNVRDLTNYPEGTALDTIKNDGFILGQRTTAYSNTIPAGSVSSQSPPPDTAYEKGGKIDIVISQGPQIVTVQVPELTGLTLDAATKKLENSGLKLGAQVILETGNENDDGKISIQKPVSGTPVNKGTAVDVTIYKFSKALG